MIAACFTPTRRIVRSVVERSRASCRNSSWQANNPRNHRLLALRVFASSSGQTACSSACMRLTIRTFSEMNCRRRRVSRCSLALATGNFAPVRHDRSPPSRSCVWRSPIQSADETGLWVSAWVPDVRATAVLPVRQGGAASQHLSTAHIFDINHRAGSVLAPGEGDVRQVHHRRPVQPQEQIAGANPRRRGEASRHDVRDPDTGTRLQRRRRQTAAEGPVPPATHAGLQV
jgi:hypothetical protein